jgi:CubicO group peptidase (beta-lactamase class C family)
MTDFDEIQKKLGDAIASSGVPGASIALWDGQTLHTIVAGVRNSVTQDPVTTDTLMHIGSITKIFNTTLVMQLVDEGLVSLDDPVLQHLPDLKLGDMAAAARITVRMLLNHTSGIDCMLLPDHGPDLERIQDAVERFAAVGQLHAPGAGPSYCNAATVIAGFMVQTLRGESWFTLIKNLILEPLALDHSLVDLTDIPKFRVSVGELTDPATGKTFQTTRPFLPLSFSPAGATMMMSASDLVTFARMHLGQGVGSNGARVLSASAVATMQRSTATVLEPKGWQWGVGWNLLPGGLLFHGGGGPGVSSALYVDPKGGRAVALLTNSDAGFGMLPEVLGPVLSDWSGTDYSNGIYPKPEVSVPDDYRMSEEERQSYLGRFENNMIRVEIVPAGDGIGLRHSVASAFYDNTIVEACPAASMKALGDHLFTVNAPGFMGNVVRFLPPQDGERSQGIGFHVHMLMRTN